MHPGTGSNHLSRSNNSARKAKPQTLKELEKYVTENRMIMEELKADLKSIRYEIVNKLIEFTKFGQSLAAEKQEAVKGKTDRDIRIAKLEGMLKVTAEEIEKKEAQETEILENYYATRASYLKNHQRWRNAVYREVARLRSEGKTSESPEMAQFSKLLIKGDDNANEFEKRTTTEWRGQMLAEKNVFFDAENGKLGQGAFGAVYKGRVFHSECAIKVLSTKQMSETAKEEFKAEVITLSNLQHDRVLRFLGAVLDDKKMMLVTELCANGSMADRLFPPLKVKKTNTDDDSDDDDCEDRPRKPVAGKKKKTYYTLSPKKKLHIMRGIIEGLIFLHEHKIVHYDLKPENILLDEEFNPVIADFGLARILNIEDVLGMSSGMGTPFYMAPEMLTTPVQLSPKCDVYAFGFIAWELWTQERNEWAGSMTGSGINTQSLYNIIKSGKRPSLDRPDKPFPHTMKLLITKCWDFDPNNRPDFKYMQFVVQDPSVLEKAKKWNELKDSLRESANQKKSEQVKELEKFLCMLPNDAFFVMYDELTVAEVSKNTKTWDEIVRNIEGIKPGEKTGPLDSYELPWEKFVVEYPKVMGLPEFKAEEHILFRIFMIQDQATQAVPVVTKKDYDLYLKFYNPKPDFVFLQELLNLPYYFGRYENKDRMMAAFKDDSYCYFIRQSSNIPSYVISFKSGPQTPVSSCPLSTETSMDSVSLLKFLKDRNNILKKMTAHCQERVEKSKWHEVKSIFRPDALAVAQLELKEIKDLRSKLKKKNLKDQDVKVKHPNAGMYVFGGPLPENGEDDDGVATFAKGESKFT